MPSNYETFFERQAFAVVGHSANSPFPTRTYGGLKRKGKTVFAIDPSVERIDDDKTYPDFDSLPAPVDAVVIEVPKAEVLGWVERAMKAGIKDVWLHQNRDTPEVLAFAREQGLNLRYGTCAVQYVNSGLPHSVHKLIRRILKRY